MDVNILLSMHSHESYDGLHVRPTSNLVVPLKPSTVKIRHENRDLDVLLELVWADVVT